MFDEKRLKREVLGNLFIIFAVFIAIFLTSTVYLGLKLRDDALANKYLTVGKAFQFVMTSNIETLKSSCKNLLSIEKGTAVLSTLKKLNPNVIYVEISENGSEKKWLGDRRFKNVCPPGKVEAAISEKYGRVVISVSVSDGESLMCAVEDVTAAFKKAEEELGGKFFILDETVLEDEGISLEDIRNAGFYIKKKGNELDIYYLLYSSAGENYFLKWEENVKTSPLVVRLVLFIVIFFLPLFLVLIYIIHRFGERIFKDVVMPLKKLVEALDDLISTTSSSSQELAASSQELAASTKELEEKGRVVNQLTRNVMEDFEKTEEFSGSVTEFTEFLKNSLENFEKIIANLFSSIHDIQKMGGFIQQIGERIVVLSINASIESARDTIDRNAIKALADEIGSLSETTTERVNEIFASLQNAVDKLDELDVAFKNIINETERLSISAKKLLDMVKSNKGEFEKIQDAIEAIFTAIEEINFASQNLAESATELSNRAYDAQKIIDEFENPGSNSKKEGEKDV